MSNPILDHSILNLSYAFPRRHTEWDTQGQPMQKVVDKRLLADFIPRASEVSTIQLIG